MMTNAMTKAIPALLLAAFSLIAVSAGGAEGGTDPPTCVDAAIDAIQKRYESVSDLSATFVQTTRSVALSGSGRTGAVTSRGTVVFAKPGKMRWSYEEPEPSLVVSDGKTLWLYDPAHAEVQRTSVSDGYLSGAAIQFLLGEGDIRRDFRVTALACDEGAAELELVPRRDASYEKLRVLAGLPSGELRRTTIFDLLGNITEVEFSDIRANQSPGKGVFQFEAPDGVSVIDLDVS
jgi:outer membrane lipoprotein carrier protein